MHQFFQGAVVLLMKIAPVNEPLYTKSVKNYWLRFIRRDFFPDINNWLKVAFILAFDFWINAWWYKMVNFNRPPPFASYYDTIFSNKISRRVFTPLLNTGHHCNPHKITFQTGGQVPSEHYTNRNNHIFTHRLAKDSKFHIHKILNIS